MTVPPFWSMPVLAPTLPLTTTSPPRIAAAVSEPAFFSITTTPDIMFFLAGRPSDSPGDDHLRPIDHAEAEVPEAALKPDATPRQDADADGVLGAGVADRHLGHALLVEEPAQFQVDLAGGQLGGVEAGRLTGDLRDLGNGRERLGQPSGVVGDASRAGRFYSDHTRTWLSYGS